VSDWGGPHDTRAPLPRWQMLEETVTQLISLRANSTMSPPITHTEPHVPTHTAGDYGRCGRTGKDARVARLLAGLRRVVAEGRTLTQVSASRSSADMKRAS